MNENGKKEVLKHLFKAILENNASDDEIKELLQHIPTAIDHIPYTSRTSEQITLSILSGAPVENISGASGLFHRIVGVLARSKGLEQ
ncbi:MAG TPA: hypothetical protein VM639_00855 [Dongiaceae bacterium]|nr:hypothetical protein [Dongiaceae bacterium]